MGYFNYITFGKHVAYIHICVAPLGIVHIGVSAERRVHDGFITVTNSMGNRSGE
jgi:hypothetical protein